MGKCSSRHPFSYEGLWTYWLGEVGADRQIFWTGPWQFRWWSQEHFHLVLSCKTITRRHFKKTTMSYNSGPRLRYSYLVSPFCHPMKKNFLLAHVLISSLFTWDIIWVHKWLMIDSSIDIDWWTDRLTDTLIDCLINWDFIKYLHNKFEWSYWLDETRKPQFHVET